MTMDHGMCNIETGYSINIKRTDGRVHSAVVSGVNWEQRTVTVEWFERGETKGKEVEMDAILALNPELGQKTMGPPPQMNNHMLASSKARHSTRPSIPVKAAPVNGHGDTVATALTGRREVENISLIPTTTPTSLNVNAAAAAAVAAAQSKQKQAQQQQAQQQQAQMENGRNRRSNVVKEVERLKKNREERRQRQAELKEEKEALMNLDPGNPNWEFLAMIREYQNSIEFRPLRESDAVEDHQITVCVRKRPLNKKEVARKEVDVISVPSKDQMVVHEPKAKVDLTKYLENQIFRFDYAFDETCNNEIVYKYTAKPLVQTIFEGGMATCFAYGQTGSGKTHTMGGDFNGKTQDCKKGIYAMVAKDVFKYLKLAKYRPLNLVISASFFEIYSGKVFDLLADKEKLRVLEDGKQQVQIVGLTEKVVETCDEVLKLIQHGNSARTSGQTSANSNSSRSHAVFQIIARTPGTQKVHGKFSLIDLAGNERGADTSSANRQTRMEGAEINKSLLALKECIRALSRKGTHLPFRASKLTQVLRDSFIGEKSKTCMIAMISPGMSSCEHSLNTLRYADRVKELAATDPTEIKVSPTDDDRVLKMEEQTNNSVLSDSDLAQLRSLNEGELSQDLYTFHEAVSALQLLEEEVLDTHKVVMDSTTRFLNDAHSVFSATHEVDYDQEDSCAKAKPNSIFTLSQNWRDTGTTLNTTILISDNIGRASGSEMRTDLNTTVNITAKKNSSRSSWRNETRLSSDCSSNESQDELSIPRTITGGKNSRRRNSAIGIISQKRNINGSLITKGTPYWRASQTPRAKRPADGKKKISKYHWNGKFNEREKFNSRSDCNEIKIFNLPNREKEPLTSDDNITNYNYNSDKKFIDKMSLPKERIFCSDKLNLKNGEFKTDEDDAIRDCRPDIDFPVEEFDASEEFKDNIRQNLRRNDSYSSTPRMYNANLSDEPRRVTDKTYSQSRMIRVSDTQASRNENTLSEAHDESQLAAKNISSNLVSHHYARKNEEVNRTDNEDRLPSKKLYRKCCSTLLWFLKNLLLFTLLPIAYIAFFIYAEQIESR